MQTPTIVYLVRHGRVYNPENIFYGRLPRFPLSVQGMEEARSAARALSSMPVAALFTSPLLRARQTAREICKVSPRRRLKISGLLTEVLSAYEGCPAEEVDAINDDIYTGVEPPFEQPSDIVRRFQKFAFMIRKQFAGQHVVAVTHGDIITFMILWAKGFPLTPGNKVTLAQCEVQDSYPATGSITTLTYTTASRDERPGVSYLNPGKVNI